jgi:hypothetical protein
VVSFQPGGAQVVGEYVYFLEDVLAYPQHQPKADQSNQKLGDAVAIAEDVILVDEHVTLQTKLYRVSRSVEIEEYLVLHSGRPSRDPFLG